MLEMVISGFQNGADISAIRAASVLDIKTSGWMPKGFKTLDGTKPEYEYLYNAKEHESPNYPPRTFLNVKESDGTLRFASNFKSPGELCTLKAIKQYKKPHLDIDINDPPAIDLVAQWIIDNNIKILNVAGNSKKTAPNIEDFVYNYMIKVLSSIQKLS